MNRNQWFVFGIGLIIFGTVMIKMTGGPCLPSVLEGEALISCYIRRYSYSIPATISYVIGIIFTICGFLETKRKN